MEENEFKQEWERNKNYFKSVEQELIKKGHKGDYVLIYEQKIYFTGENDAELFEKFYKEKGDQPFYLEKIGEEEIVDVPSPELD